MSTGAALRVLVIDDSVVMRQIITDSLRGDPRITVVGTAQNGKVGLEKIAELKPDVVTLDLEMPELDGLGVLDALKARGVKLPVVVFSTLTEHGARATLDALARGASDYVGKPSGQRNVTATIERIRGELVPKIHAVFEARRRAPLKGAPAPAPAAAPVQLLDTPLTSVDVIAIGVSTGGPSALAEIIPHLPGDLDVPVLIVQHMPPAFTKVMAERLASTSALRVREATHGATLERRTVLIAPGDYHMRVSGRTRIVLDQEPPQNGSRPSVDVLFESVAGSFGRSALAIVLTGLGHDGMRGAAAIRRSGGHVWVQDEASCAARGMPGAVVNAGLANRVVALRSIAPSIANAAHARGGPPSEQRKLR